MATTSHKAYTQASVSLHSTSLNALANASNSAVSAAHDNSVNLDLYADFSMFISTQVARTGTPTVELYIVRSLEVTSPVYDDALETINDKIATFTYDTAVTARRMTKVDVPIPPGFFKIYVRNLTSQTFAATLNTLTMRTHSLQTL